MSSLQQFTDKLSSLPGIGPRQAKRLAYYISARGKDYIMSLQNSLEEIEKEVKNCPSCRGLFFSKNSEKSFCEICSEDRDNSSLMIVGTEIDRDTIEKANVFKGNYFILRSYLSIMENNVDKLPHKELEKRINDLASKRGLREVVIGLNCTPEGDHTTSLLKEHLLPICKKMKISLFTLGRGLSTGGEVEYSDPETLKYALENRK